MPSPTDPARPGAPALAGGPVLADLADADPGAAVDALAAATVPYLIGVRHHSPALSVVLPELLAKAAPDVLLVELPPEFTPWLPYLTSPETVAPVALAGVVDGRGGPACYPFADFSPELVALRWAAREGVPVVACDLPLADRAWWPPESGTVSEAGPVEGARPADGAGCTFARALRDAATGRPGDDLWDRTVEALAPGADPEAVRRAALAVGWALRADAAARGGPGRLDLRREAWMRRRLAEQSGRVVALVGSFHAGALLAPAGASPAGTTGDAPPSGATVVTSLVPYTFALLDARSGYPAGIQDPGWQQTVLEAAGDPAAVEAAVTGAVVRVCAEVRAAGHPAGPAEAREAVRLAVDLSRLRGLPAPGRGELVEAVQSVLAHGEVQGRGRAVAAAMERVLIGRRRGMLAPGTPQSGLNPAVRRLIAELRLPGPGDPSRDLRLDPLRGDLDRRREVTLHRLAACDVPYGEPVEVEGVAGVDALTSRWRVCWTPPTDAMLDVAGMLGVRLDQAAEGALRERRRRESADGGPTAGEVVGGLWAAAVCGLPTLVTERLAEVSAVVPAIGSLGETVAALAVLDRIRLGDVAGLRGPDAASGVDRASGAGGPSGVDGASGAGGPSGVGGAAAGVAEVLEAAAVRQLDGLAGSQDLADVRALVALAGRAAAAGGGLRLADALVRLAAGGTPLVAAAAGTVQVLLGHADAVAFGLRIASWVDTATHPESRADLRWRLTGTLAASEPLLQTGGAVLTGLLDRIETMPDRDFLDRLPALRGGFHALSPAARGRLLEIVDERIGTGHDVGNVDDPEALLAALVADRAGLAALVAEDLPVPVARPATPDGQAPDGPAADGPACGARELPVPDRWRLVLGREPGALGAAGRRYATALDELYGHGHGRGEGSRDGLADRGGASGSRGGHGAPFPTVREWARELEELFGRAVREEVLASAVEAGRTDVALLLDPDAVRPSVDLLRDLLTLAGGMPESTVARLRPLIARIVEQLTRELAVRLRPALVGITTPRPTYRPGGPLDLARTVRRNIAVSTLREDGSLLLVPRQPVFRSRARRGVDWRLVLVVDVSGSMESSVIWSALTSAVLAGVPALTTHFVAFSTKVVDLTDRVSDPLSLLLEVRVGGGTHIAAGLRYARSLVTVPTRTMVVVVSDFEEGYPVSGLLGEVRTLRESGCTLLGCASLDDQGRPRYSVSTAAAVVAAGMPVAALSPLELARWVGEQVAP